jgi:hypothetical protein
MPSKVTVFFAGVTTTFAVIAAGFGGGVMLAQSALNGPPAPPRVISGAEPTARVVLANLPDTPVPTEARPPALGAAKQPLKEDSSKEQESSRFETLRAEVQKRVEERAQREKRRHAERKIRAVVRTRAVQQPAMAYASDQTTGGWQTPQLDRSASEVPFVSGD